MFSIFKILIAAGFLWSAPYAFANVEASLSLPDESLVKGRSLPSISFFDENGKRLQLSALTKGQAILMIPFYTHCKSTCPLNVAHLESVLKDRRAQGYRVVLFSFSPEDTSQDLRDFRKTLNVPNSWIILRADSKDTISLLETLDFRYMTQGSDFVHTNTLVVLTPTLKVSRLIQGIGYTTSLIEDSVGAANDSDKTSGFFPLFFLVLLGFTLGGISLWARNKGRQLVRPTTLNRSHSRTV